jgi:hypothetical protein
MTSILPNAEGGNLFPGSHSSSACIPNAVFACGHSLNDHDLMASRDDRAAMSGQEWVVIASFENRRAAEHMLASLGREFRSNARKGHADAFVVTSNADGSLKLTESRVLEASGFAATMIHLSLSWTVGFMGLVSTLKGAKRTAHAVHEHGSHVGSDEQQAHAIIAQAGPGAAITLVHCKNREMGRMVAAGAAGHASYSWDGSRADFLAGLDPGAKDDWVRAALDEPLSPKP